MKNITIGAIGLFLIACAGFLFTTPSQANNTIALVLTIAGFYIILNALTPEEEAKK